jgi:hypothetical protein
MSAMHSQPSRVHAILLACTTSFFRHIFTTSKVIRQPNHASRQAIINDMHMTTSRLAHWPLAKMNTPHFDMFNYFRYFDFGRKQFHDYDTPCEFHEIHFHVTFTPSATAHFQRYFL